MSDRDSIRRIDFDAAKQKAFEQGWNGARDYYTKSLITKALEGQQLNECLPEPKPAPKRDYNRLRLTMSDLKFFYEVGISCE